jgi:hypothetical protein
LSKSSHRLELGENLLVLLLFKCVFGVAVVAVAVAEDVRPTEVAVAVVLEQETVKFLSRRV